MTAHDVLGTVHVWSSKGTVPKSIRDWLDNRVPVEGHASTNQAGGYAHDAPSKVDYYVHGGRDSAAVQMAAAQLGSKYGAITLPEGAPWLADRVHAAVHAGRPVTIWVRGGAG